METTTEITDNCYGHTGSFEEAPLDYTQSQLTASICYSNVCMVSSDLRYSFNAVVEVNGESCVYDYLCAVVLKDDLCKDEYTSYFKLDEDGASILRLNKDDASVYSLCLSILLPELTKRIILCVK